MSEAEDTAALLEFLQEATKEAKDVEERQRELLAEHQHCAEQISTELESAVEQATAECEDLRAVAEAERRREATPEVAITPTIVLPGSARPSFNATDVRARSPTRSLQPGSPN